MDVQQSGFDTAISKPHGPIRVDVLAPKINVETSGELKGTVEIANVDVPVRIHPRQ